MSNANTGRPQGSPQDVEAVLGANGHFNTARIAKALGIAVTAVAILGGAAYWLLGGTQPDIAYLTETVRRGNLTVVVTATGTVQPTNKVEISTELSGTVRKVLVDYNSVVMPGQVLAELDTDKLEATVASARAKLAAARAWVTEAAATIEEKRGDYERKAALFEKGVASPQEMALARAAFDRAVAAHASALAEVSVAEADLRLSETNLAKACICSPIKGVVLQRNVDPGQTVAATFQAPVLFTIAEDLAQMELQVDVDEADVGRTKAGQKATFTVDAHPGLRFPAEIRDIRFAPETVQGVVVYKALLDIDNSDLLLRPGMTATADILVEEVRDALLAPNAALRFIPPAAADRPQTRTLIQRIIPTPPRVPVAPVPEADGLDRTVWLLRDGVPLEVAVVVGATDGRFTEIMKGDIKVGDLVITDTR